MVFFVTVLSLQRIPLNRIGLILNRNLCMHAPTPHHEQIYSAGTRKPVESPPAGGIAACFLLLWRHNLMSLSPALSPAQTNFEFITVRCPLLSPLLQWLNPGRSWNVSHLQSTMHGWIRRSDYTELGVR